MRHAARHPGGFTLIELLVTIAVAAMLGMLVVPNLVSMVQSGKTSVLVNKFPQDVAWARNLAVTTQQPVVMTLGPGNCVWSTTVAGTQNAEHSMLNPSTQYPGATCTISGAASQTLSFTAQGFVSNSPTITVTTPNNQQTWTMQVLSSGSVILNSNTAS
uniref:Putative Tfp pilus assembly protein, major pilin PilA n=1 Tax=mine drainage metagenome TaxID=410659 RepID=E6PLY8_9ZZZZ